MSIVLGHDSGSLLTTRGGTPRTSGGNRYLNLDRVLADQSLGSEHQFQVTVRCDIAVLLLTGFGAARATMKEKSRDSGIPTSGSYSACLPDHSRDEP